MDTRCLSWYARNGVFWFRIFGYGLHFKPRKGHVPLFSERYGHTKCWYVGPVRIAWLKP